jgi:hypothetical protein
MHLLNGWVQGNKFHLSSIFDHKKVRFCGILSIRDFIFQALKADASWDSYFQLEISFQLDKSHMRVAESMPHYLILRLSLKEGNFYPVDILKNIYKTWLYFELPGKKSWDI